MVFPAATESTPAPFRLLGPVSVTVDGAEVALGGPRQVAVLARLLLSPSQIVSMDQLVDAVWDGDAPSRPDAAIRSYVSNLRKLIEPHRELRGEASCLVSIAPGYRLVVDRNAIDWVNFEDLVSFGQRLLADYQPLAAATQLRSALALWQGEPFGGLPDAEVFSAHKTRLSDIRAVANELLYEAQLATGGHRAVSATIESTIADYPYRERLTELGMLALYRSGRQPAALSLAQALGQRLREQLGIDPGPRIKQLELKILNHDPSLSPDAPAITPASEGADEVDDLNRARQVGEIDRDRGEQISSTVGAVGCSTTIQGDRVIAQAATRVQSGEGSLVLVSGAFGTGKSEFAQHLSSVLKTEGAICGWSRAVGGDWMADSDMAAQPFWPWNQALADLVRSVSPSTIISAREALDLGPLAQIGAAVVGPLDLREDPSVVHTCADVMMTVVRFLRYLADGGPIALFFDDFHLADAVSVALVEFAAGSLGDAAVTLVPIWRPGAVEETEAAIALGGLARLRSAVRMNLESLDVHHLDGLLMCHGIECTDRELGRLAAESGGNALFALEMARGRETPGGWARSASLTNTVHSFVSRLGSEANLLLSIGAISRLPFTALDLCALSELDLATVEEVLALAKRRAVLITSESNPNGYRFGHPIVAEVLADQIPGTERARQHGALGTLLAERGASAFEVAYHLSRSSSPEDHLKAASLAIGSLQRSVDTLPFVELDQVVRRGLETARRGGDAPELLGEAELYFSWRARTSGHSLEWHRWADRALHTALELAASRARGPNDDEAAEALLADAMLNAIGHSPYSVGPGTVHIDSARASDLIPLVAAALQVLEPDSAPAKLGRIELGALRALADTTTSAQGWVKAGREARRLAMGDRRRASPPDAELGLPVLNWFGMTLGTDERLDVLEMTTAADVSLSHALSIERHWHRELVDQGETAKALSRLHPILTVADRNGNQFHQARARALLARHLLWIGSTVKARQTLADLVSRFENLELPLGDAVVEQLFELRRLEGRADQFLVSPEWLDESGNSALSRSARSALLYATVGRQSLAARWLLQATDELEWDRAPTSNRAGCLAWMAEAGSQLDSDVGINVAHAIVDPLAAMDNQLLTSPGGLLLIGPASYFAGLCLGMLGEIQPALDKLADARGRCQTIGAGPAELRTMVAERNLLWSAGQTKRAGQVAAQAGALAARLGLAWDHRQIGVADLPTVTTDLWVASN